MYLSDTRDLRCPFWTAPSSGFMGEGKTVLMQMPSGVLGVWHSVPFWGQLKVAGDSVRAAVRWRPVWTMNEGEWPYDVGSVGEGMCHQTSFALIGTKRGPSTDRAEAGVPSVPADDRLASRAPTGAEAGRTLSWSPPRGPAL